MVRSVKVWNGNKDVRKTTLKQKSAHYDAAKKGVDFIRRELLSEKNGVTSFIIGQTHNVDDRIKEDPKYSETDVAYVLFKTKKREEALAVETALIALFRHETKCKNKTGGGAGREPGNASEFFVYIMVEKSDKRSKRKSKSYRK